MILKKYDYFRIENVMFMMDNYDINTVYEKYIQLNKKERKRLLGIFSKCPQNKMAYEMIMVYHLHMPFFIAIFPCILT